MPNLGFLFFGLIWNIYRYARRQNRFPIVRFLRANRLRPDDVGRNAPQSLRIEVLFVATGTDLEILPFAVRCAQKALSNYIQPIKVNIIVPSGDLEMCSKFFESFEDILVIDEDTLLSEYSRNALKIKFKSRYGWCLQQLLKMQFVLTSNSDAVLIVDADTLLLHERPWLNQDSVQILTPSDEFNGSYYNFLSSFGLSVTNPKYTFVAHHMLIQRKYLKEMMEFAGWRDIENVVSSLLTYPFENLTSPFSIDYEAYAQYLFSYHPEAVELSKWSNISVARSSDLQNQIPKLLDKYRGLYSSISLHAYLK